MFRYDRQTMRDTVILLAIILAVMTIVMYFMVRSSVDLKLKGAEEITISVGDTYKDPGTNIPAAKKVGTVDTKKAGDYAISYTFANKIVRRVVHVVNPDKLVVTLKGSKETIVREGDPYVESGAYAVDRDNGPIETYQKSGTVDTSKPGTYKIKYTFKDNYLKKSVTRTVRVVSQSEYVAATQVTVLRYKNIYSDEDTPDVLESGDVSVDDFQIELKYLKDNGYYFPSYKELRAYLDGKIHLPVKSVIITVDDSGSDFLKNAISAFDEEKVPGTVFLVGKKNADSIITKYAGSYVLFESYSYDMDSMSKDNTGHTVMADMTQDKIEEDLTKCSQILGTNDAFAYPDGDVTTDGQAAVENAGLDCAFTETEGRVTTLSTWSALPRKLVTGSYSESTFHTFMESTT
ncbi:MAG: immunoglobulin-like domain-containing protein [Anaerovoracaceae bacterium]|jgi:hypothetical protein